MFFVNLLGSGPSLVFHIVFMALKATQRRRAVSSGWFWRRLGPVLQGLGASLEPLTASLGVLGSLAGLQVSRRVLGCACGCVEDWFWKILSRPEAVPWDFWGWSWHRLGPILQGLGASRGLLTLFGAYLNGLGGFWRRHSPWRCLGDVSGQS